MDAVLDTAVEGGGGYILDNQNFSSGTTNYTLNCETGAYTLTGIDATLTYASSGPTAYTLTCETGLYTLEGADARLLVNGVAEASSHGFVIVDMPSTMWWKRKPNAMPEAVAKKKVKRVAKAIEQVARKEDVTQRDVREAIAPYLAEMPGFDWKQLYRQIVVQNDARKRMQAAMARAKQIEQDDEDVLLLMLL